MASSTTTPNAEPSPSTTVAELRKQYGSHFAPGYGEQDTLGQLLGRAGVSTLQEYLAQGSPL